MCRNHTYTRSHIRSTLGPMASPPPAVVAAPTVKNTTISVLSIDAIFPFTLTTLPAYTTPSNSSIIWYTTSEAASASLPPIYAPPAGAEDEEDAADVVEENVMGGVEGLTFKETPPATSSSPSVNAAATSPTLLVNLAITSLTLSVNSAVIGAVIVDLAKTSGVMSTPVPAPTSVAVSYTSGGWVYIRHTSSIA
jgi:hypothetical protein